jgi:hypothetical protein
MSCCGAESLLEKYFEILMPMNLYQQFLEKTGSGFFSTTTTVATLMAVDWISPQNFLLMVPEEKKKCS